MRSPGGASEERRPYTIFGRRVHTAKSLCTEGGCARVPRPSLAEYVGLLKLRIAALLLLVAASGYLVTSGPDVRPVPFLLLMGAGLLASAGASAMNHYADRDLDPAMARTRSRPIPQGRVPPSHALALGVALLVGGIGLSLLVNP